MPRLSAAAYLGRDRDSIRMQMRADNKALELLMESDRIFVQVGCSRSARRYAANPEWGRS